VSDIIIKEVGVPAQPKPLSTEKSVDIQDILILLGVATGETAAAVIWWPASLILACLLSFAFAWMIERSKVKQRAVK
jgi:hypothetical protein